MYQYIQGEEGIDRPCWGPSHKLHWQCPQLQLSDFNHVHDRVWLHRCQETWWGWMDNAPGEVHVIVFQGTGEAEVFVISYQCLWLLAQFKCSLTPSEATIRARENMQFEKVKKEIINSKKRDYVQNHTFYAEKRDFLQKVRNAVQKSI